MRNVCVIVADRARARFFMIQPGGELDAGRRLVELEDLVNPEGKLTGGELFSNERSGPAPAPGGGPAHNYDDHRSQHLDEIARRFARDLADAAIRFVRDRAARSLVLVAAPRFLGILRPELQAKWPREVTLFELSEELSWHSAAHIHNLLARKGLLPAERPSGEVFRARGLPPRE